MAQLLSDVYTRFFDLNGVPLAGGKLYSYQAGTSILQATYTDQGALTPNPNPVILDSAGGAQIWIKNTGYKLTLNDSQGNQQWSVDNVYLIEPNSVGSGQLANGAVGTAQIANSAVTTAKIATGAITTALLAAASVTSGTIAAGAVTISVLDPNIDLSQLASSIEVVFRRTDDLSGGRILAIPQYPWSSPSQQNNPSTIPTGAGTGAKFSPDGKFLAVANAVTPFITIYEIAGTSFNKLPDPATLPAGAATSCAWSPNGDFLVVGHATTPFITIYQRQGINFTKLSNPGTLPGAAATPGGIAFSPNGEFLAVSSTGGFNIYNVIGTTFTEISGSAGITSPSGKTGKVAWSWDSQYLALSNGTGSGNFFNCFQRTGLTFTAMTIAVQPATLPISLIFTRDGLNILGGFSTSPAFAFAYGISGSTLTGPTTPFAGVSPVSAVSSIAISPNGTMVAVTTSGTTPFLQIYTGSVAGGWTLNAAPATPMTAQCNEVDWSPTGKFIVVAVTLSPYVNIYMTASSIPSKGLFYCRNFFDV